MRLYRYFGCTKLGVWTYDGASRLRNAVENASQDGSVPLGFCLVCPSTVASSGFINRISLKFLYLIPLVKILKLQTEQEIIILVCPFGMILKCQRSFLVCPSIAASSELIQQQNFT
ncbi:hypothetical protein CDAR_486371 [Caerostris darwini]|uniref:Uncharacterized protein n=1 Tax=Caerostris darwini TaxID=1538125 RepID=A0AAV4MBU9_9ARAC|nr:hypothetical protein CDAR_486371 [Caerostris darwini]